MSEQPPTSEPGGLSLSLSALSIFGLILSFLLVVIVLVAINRPAPVGDRTSQKRDNTLMEVRSWHEEILTSYGWIDQSAGIVRVPIERAMELTLKDLSDEPPADDSP